MLLKELKCNLQSGEFVVLCDFAENYSLVLQDEAQQFHWNNALPTIHPFVIYFKKSDALNTEHECLIISDCLMHDSILVHTFQWHVMQFIENTFESPLKKKNVHFCDGSAAQYKNRTSLLNITCHNEDHGVPAEWHFFVTSHGKSDCDGVGGTLKRLAAKANLQ
jgi:hypothetical protein